MQTAQQRGSTINAIRIAGSGIVDLLVLCPCGHPQGIHTDAGCLGGRYRACDCKIVADAVVDEAIAMLALDSAV
jgi:hypothetical protein